MRKAAQYVISVYSQIFSYPLDKILEVGYLSQNGDPIPSFDENLLIDLCQEAREIFEKEPNVLQIQGDFIIVGDIHGSFHDLLRILKFIIESSSKVLFLGDYVDRGNFSLECITILFAMKVLEPERFYLLRGNHEVSSICSQHGFKDEILNYHNPKKDKNAQLLVNNMNTIPLVNSFNFNIDDDEQEIVNDDDNEFHNNYKDTWCYQYTEALFEAFVKTFSFLPIASILNGKTFCIHGGLSPKLKNVFHLNKMITRPIETFEENTLFSDVVWSDPSDSFQNLFIENPRGRGYIFNEYSLKNFLNDNALFRMIRAHQCVQNGSLFQFDDKCITVFSASCYNRKSENFSGVLQLFENDDRIEVFTFSPIKRLQKSDAIYYKVEKLDQNCPNNIRHYFSLRHPKWIPNSNVKIVAKHRGNKMNCQSTSCLPMSCSQFQQSQLVKPKLTTNAKKSPMKIAPKQQMLQLSGSAHTIDTKKNEMTCNSTNAKYLSKSLHSLSDLLKEKKQKS